MCHSCGNAQSVPSPQHSLVLQCLPEEGFVMGLGRWLQSVVPGEESFHCRSEPFQSRNILPHPFCEERQRDATIKEESSLPCVEYSNSGGGVGVISSSGSIGWSFPCRFSCVDPGRWKGLLEGQKSTL